jgi:putative flippase GtrA
MNRQPNLALTAFADRYGYSLIAYGCVSVVSALAEWLSFYFALSWFEPARAAAIGFVIATALNFFLSHHFAFRSKRSYWNEVLLVIGMSTAAFVANFSLFYVLYALAGVNVLYAKIIGTCFGFAFNYTVRQFMIFSRVPRFGPVSRLLKGETRIHEDEVSAKVSAASRNRK